MLCSKIVVVLPEKAVQENLLQVEGLNDTEICKGFIQKCMQGIRLYSYENRILQRQHPLKWPNY